MIARFRILLTYSFTLREDLQLPPFKLTFKGYDVTIYPPHQAMIDPTDLGPFSELPLKEIPGGLRPADPPKTASLLRVDNKPAIQANMLQLDFHRPEFNRSEGKQGNDPPIDLMFELVNNVLATLRTVTEAAHIKQLVSVSTIWRLDYLTDEQVRPMEEKGLVRSLFGAGFHLSLVPMNDEVWNDLERALPTYSPTTWETLLHDASSLLPEVGPALVLAATALETLIAATVDYLATQTAMPPNLWQWINNRGDYRKEPSVEEQFDTLLSIFANKSLKEDKKLWPIFKNLKEARNNFVHGGRAVLGKHKNIVTPDMALGYIIGAREIVAWIEPLLPPELKRPVITAPTSKIEFTRTL